MPPFFAEIGRVLRPGGHVDRRRQPAAPRRRSTRPPAVLERGFRAPRASRPRRQRRGGGAGTFFVGRSEPAGRLTAPMPERRAATCCSSTHPPGGGRARELLPQVEAALAPPRPRAPLVLTDGLEHGCEEALAGAAAGEIPVVMSGDGLIGQVGGALAGHRDAAGHHPRRARQRPRPRARDPDRRRTPRWRCSPAAHGGEIDVGEVNGSSFLCIASCGFDSDANRIANEAKLVKGNLVYAYAALRALVAWKPATFTLDARRRAHASCAATRSPPPTARPTAAACSSPRTPSSTTACSTSSRSRRRRQAPLPPQAPAEGLQGRATSSCPRSDVARAAEVRIEADRPFAVYADGDHLADLPATRARPARRRSAGDRPRMTRRRPVSDAGFRAKVALARADRRAQPPQRPRRRHHAPRAAAAADRAGRDLAARRRLSSAARRSSAPRTARRRPRACSPRRCAPPDASRSTTAPGRT